jgi:hypothetical protein
MSVYHSRVRPYPLPPSYPHFLSLETRDVSLITPYPRPSIVTRRFWVLLMYINPTPSSLHQNSNFPLLACSRRPSCECLYGHSFPLSTSLYQDPAPSQNSCPQHRHHFSLNLLAILTFLCLMPFSFSSFSLISYLFSIISQLLFLLRGCGDQPTSRQDTLRLGLLFIHLLSHTIRVGWVVKHYRTPTKYTLVLMPLFRRRPVHMRVR